jgi:RNA polymerase sigma-70 factor (ECF subfamily)
MSTMEIHEVSDAELIQRAARSDTDAFDALYRRHSGRVLGLALRRLHDRGRAEDAVQETFTAIWRAAGTYKPERGSGTAWLYTVARNAIVDRSRRRVDPVVADAPDLAVDGPGPDGQAEAGWVGETVRRAVADLPEHEREVIALAYWHGLSNSEVAAQLGIPLGTVKTRIRRGLARLADTPELEQLL